MLASWGLPTAISGYVTLSTFAKAAGLVNLCVYLPMPCGEGAHVGTALDSSSHHVLIGNLSGLTPALLCLPPAPPYCAYSCPTVLPRPTVLYPRPTVLYSRPTVLYPHPIVLTPALLCLLLPYCVFQMFKGPDKDIEFIYTAPSSAVCGVSLDVGGKKEYLIAGV